MARWALIVEEDEFIPHADRCKADMILRLSKDTNHVGQVTYASIKVEKDKYDIPPGITFEWAINGP